MSHQRITFNAELIDNEIKIRLNSHTDNQELAIEAASKLFASLERVGIEVTRENLEKDWHLEP